jgi:HK97 family phage portal protein
MGLLTRMASPAAHVPSPNDERYWTGDGPLAASGVLVTPEAALKVSSFYACIKIIAETLAQVSLGLFNRRADGGRERAEGEQLDDVLHRKPNRWQTSYEWREMGQGHALLRGNFYSRIVVDGAGEVEELIPLHPARVVPQRVLETGAIRYEYTDQNGYTKTYLQDEIFHVPGFSTDGVMGLSLVGLARESLGLALATESHGSRLFSQGTSPTGVLKHPGKLSPQASRRISRDWNRSRGGRLHGTAVLEEGLDWVKVGLNSEEAQFLQTRHFQVAECARWLRIPLFMIQETEKSTSWGSGIESLSLAFVVFTMMSHFVRWEHRIDNQLVLNPQRQFARFVVNSLLRGNAKDRMEYFTKGIQWGMFSPNDALRLEDMNPRPGGDVYLTPLNMAPSGRDRESRMRELAREAAGRILRRELGAIAKGARKVEEQTVTWHDWLTEFYGSHAEFVSRALIVSPEEARAYTERRVEGLKVTGPDEAGRLNESALAQLMLLAVGQDDPLLEMERTHGTNGTSEEPIGAME